MIIKLGNMEDYVYDCESNVWIFWEIGKIKVKLFLNLKKDVKFYIIYL